MRIWEDEGPEQPGSVAVATSWQRKFALAVAVSDLATLAICVLLGAFIGFGEGAGPQSSDPWVLGGGVAVLVPLAIVACRAWDPRTLGQGAEEWSRLIRGLRLGGDRAGPRRPRDRAPRRAALGVRRPARRRPAGDGRALPAAALAAPGPQARPRDAPRAGRRHRAAVRDLVERTRRVPHIGWVVIAACTPTGLGEDGAATSPASRSSATSTTSPPACGSGRYGVVAVAPTPGWTPKRLHRLAWDLEGTGAELVVDPGLMEVAGPRLHVAPVDGLPLLRLTAAAPLGRAAGVQADVRPRRRRGDPAAAALPVFAVIAFVVKLDGGPVFYRQTRVGQRGKTFQMIKFRSMVRDADSARGPRSPAPTTAPARCSSCAGPARHPHRPAPAPLLARRAAPAVQRHRRLDVAGRPPPAAARRGRGLHRRAERKLLVRPGITGLWQVSGRSDLSWEESVRLDLRYVENWSPALDLVIMWKTVSAVFRGDGAY